MRYGTEERIKKLQAEIDRLRAEQEAPPAWVPEEGGWYYVVDRGVVSQYSWRNDKIDKRWLEMGEVFRTEQGAKNHLRALKLIETIRRERFKAQGNWRSSEGETRHTVCWSQLGNRAHINELNWDLLSSVFGFWQDRNALRNVIDKYESELKWYFTEYLPSIN